MENQYTIKIKGLDCASCAQEIENTLSQSPGVTSAVLNFATGSLLIRGSLSATDALERVRSLGYDAHFADEKAMSQQNPPPNVFSYLWKQRESRLALVGSLFILPAIVFHEILGRQQTWVNFLSLAALLIAGLPVASAALRALRHKTININVLMTTAAIGAVCIGAYDEAGVVIVLFAISEALEGYTTERARRSIQTMMQVIPLEATRLTGSDNEQQEKVAINDLVPGDIILVKPGERIPMDGIILAGNSSVNQSPITGESIPVEKTIGAEVLASSINGEGTLKIRVTHPATENTISRIVKMVEEAHEKRARHQKFIDRFAQIYTPVIVLLAFAVATLPPFFFQQPFLNPSPHAFGWLYRGLALLVVGCPCALVISTPVTIISAISNAARHGVLFKGGVHLETLSRVRAIAFDKTGTLTEGKPSVISVRSTACKSQNDHPDAGMQINDQCESCNDLLALASAIERHSEHPLATAIVEKAAEYNLSTRYPPAENVTALIGKGISGDIAGRKVFIGSHSHFKAADIPHPQEDCLAASTAASNGQIPLMISLDNNYLGTITVFDAIRPTAPAAIQTLKKMGIKNPVMLTGDHPQAAKRIGEQAGIEHIHAELTPEKKMSAIAKLKQKCGTIAMIGDGINDTPALALADVGIAIAGPLTTAQAMEASDITLIGNNLHRLPFAIALSRMTMNTIRFNIVFSIGIKLIFIALVILGLGSMWMAIAADMGTSLLVTINGMRLLKRPSLSQFTHLKAHP
ncbi:MAG: cation-translocating P-type ATPase [Anaerolineae bacterium]|nr:cation-translocating P-type ATPase [Anaerolineae bacterium]